MTPCFYLFEKDGERRQTMRILTKKSGTSQKLYITAPERAKQGEQMLSTDEMTGVQALERKAPGLPLASGKVQRRELEYIRHGTQALIINLEATRWHIVVDGLNTHKSETLVRTVVKHEDLDIDLGIKGKHGILK